MNLIKRLFAYTYLVVMVSVGLFFVLISTGSIKLENITETVSDSAYKNAVFVAVGSVILITGIAVFFRVIYGIRRNRIVTFRNPDGEINITVFAIEDYIQKVAKEIPNVSAAKSRVSFSKKCVNIRSAVSLKAGSNIPEVTEKIQMEVKNSLRAMLGIDEEINMVIHVNKIVGSFIPESENAPTQVPYR